MLSAPESTDSAKTVSPTERPDDTDHLHVHDGIYSPLDIVAHCARVREEIAERQKHLVDVPV